MQCNFDLRNNVIHVVQGEREKVDLTLYITNQISNFCDKKGIVLLLELPSIASNEEERIIKLICEDFAGIIDAACIYLGKIGTIYTFNGVLVSDLKHVLKKYPKFYKLL